MDIVLGYVDTPHGQRALDEATAQARAHGARLHVVVCDTTSVGEHASQARDREEGVAAAAERLDELVARLVDDGLDARGEVVRDDRDSAGAALVDYATRAEADLIVVGVRKRSRVGKLLLGSNLQDVILAAPCSVLAAKPADPASGGTVGGEEPSA
ncbi:universal stress protein [Egibacter rhizosphaerae]|uniref:Universal stress protein n=1 Tax=Egibacter rhizosphaerae TaxID=1670831 RepID=A0A411YGX8_9ACTN|nr:universal stress protein [Egibacter rhizosphaerae]QBI20406.1 universal stress protein [Egibacter rhizosphaerae]